jgi:hypothetical protein
MQGNSQEVLLKLLPEPQLLAALAAKKSKLPMSGTSAQLQHPEKYTTTLFRERSFFRTNVKLMDEHVRNFV